RLCEMTLGHVETGGRRRRAAAATTAAASPAFVTAVLQEVRPHGEVGLDGYEGDHRRRRWRGGAEQRPVPVDVEGHGHVVVGDGGGDEHVRAAPPGLPVLRHGEIQLQRNRTIRLPGQGVRRDAGCTGKRGERVTVVRSEEALELELVLTERRCVELGLHARAELGYPEREGQGPGER